jgi:hypothetical protein
MVLPVDALGHDDLDVVNAARVLRIGTTSHGGLNASAATLSRLSPLEPTEATAPASADR